MYITAKTLDDLLRRVYGKLLSSRSTFEASRGGGIELTGVLLQITNPRARLSRSENRGILFSCLGELLWYLARTNELDFIEYYIPRYRDESDDGKTVYGGYGPRLFHMNGITDQVANLIALLRTRPTSRRAVIQIFDSDDLTSDRTEVPCTCTLQFLVRRGHLHMITNMRSNDAFFGLPHDVFAFTMIQEIIARTLNLKIGTYKHLAGSLHLYDKNIEGAKRYLEEGWQSSIAMPQMPVGDPWPSIAKVLDAESIIRSGHEIDVDTLELAPYWSDLVRLLQLFNYTRSFHTLRKAPSVLKNMQSDIYLPYIRKRQARKLSEADQGQLKL